MGVSDVLFVHWSVEPSTLRHRLPDELTLDTYDGTAWLGVVTLQIENVHPRGVPFGRSFPQLNVRTYVTHDGDPGVFFFTLDAPDPIGVAIARRIFRLPYYRSEATIYEGDDERTFRSHRVHPGAPVLEFDATYGFEDDGYRAAAGTLSAFLTERYRLYVADRSNHLYTGPVEHDPWPLRDGWVDIRRNDCLRTNGFDTPGGDPTVHYSDGVDFRAGRVRRVALRG